MPLATVGDDELVASSVALALGARVGADDPGLTLTEQLAPLGPTLLVLDGCELVADGVARWCTTLLVGCPALTVLVTSRERRWRPRRGRARPAATARIRRRTTRAPCWAAPPSSCWPTGSATVATS